MPEGQANKALKEESLSKKIKDNIDDSGSKQPQRPSIWDLLDVLWWI